MPRKRTIDPDLWTDDRVQALPSALTILLYIGTISQADDEGRLEWNARQLLARVFALRDDVKLRDVENAMAAIAEAKLVETYEVGGRTFAAHPAWRKHQYVSRPAKSKIPQIPRGDSRSMHVQPTHTITEDARGDDVSRHTPSDTVTGTVSEKSAAHTHTREGDDSVLDDDELPPADPRAVRPGPSLEIATWFIGAALGAKALPEHVALDVAGAAYHEAPFADPLVLSYPLDEIKRRARNLIARRMHPTNPLRKSCSLKTLVEKWDWFDDDVAPGDKRATPPPPSAPLPARSIDALPDLSAAW